MEILTAIKILGIILSTVSVIGSERLSRIEGLLRQRLTEPEKNLIGENVIYFLVTLIANIFLFLPFVLVFLFLLYLSLGLVFPKPVIDLILRTQVFFSHLKINMILKIILCFIIAIVIAPPVRISRWLRFQVLSVSVDTVVKIPPAFRDFLLIGIISLNIIIVAALRLITLPYLWLDQQVQKRKVESTLTVIGVLLAVSSELISYFIR